MPIRGAHDVGWLSELTGARLMRRDVKTVLASHTVAARRYFRALERQRGEDLGERGLWGRN
ncbi:hypothetical protein [Azospirillum doebereinerae]